MSETRSAIAARIAAGLARVALNMLMGMLYLPDGSCRRLRGPQMTVAIEV